MPNLVAFIPGETRDNLVISPLPQTQSDPTKGMNLSQFKYYYEYWQTIDLLCFIGYVCRGGGGGGGGLIEALLWGSIID